MIDERLEELACLYALGVLEGSELREFEGTLRDSPELQKFVTRLSKPVEALAGLTPTMTPPPHLRSDILARIAPPKKFVSSRERKFSSLSWLPWGLATCLTVLCMMLFMMDRKLQKTVGDQGGQISELNHLTQSLQSATNDLQQALLGLQETNRLTHLRIAVLKSLLTNAPQAAAVTLWDNQRQTGLFVARDLKQLSAHRDYQLWVIDPQYKNPLNAGVFQVDAQGSVRKTFKTRFPVHAAEKFAVTEEPKGGEATPTLKNMVLFGS